MTVDVEARNHPCEAGNFRSMVNVYVASGVPATLFVQGGWALARATDDELAALEAEGMVVGLHGHTHRRFTELDGQGIIAELVDSEAALEGLGVKPGAAAVPPPVPGGEHGRLRAQTVATQGWWHVDCHAVAYDWKEELRHDPERVARHAIDGIEARRRAGAACAIVLFHSWPDPAPEATRRVLDALRRPR